MATSLVGATIAQAATYTYNLADHPDGNQRGNFDYGIRLDGAQPSARFFTFGNGSAAQLTYNDTTFEATLSGSVFESTGVGTVGNAYTLSYTLSGLTDLGGGFFVQETANSSGTLTLGTEVISLGTSSNGSYYFKFANDGHRLGSSTGIAGRGWIASSPGSNDFLFTASLSDTSPVPLPAAGWLMIAALGGLGAMRRRKTRD
ncbi:VPLPA-CTERM sorting domain-containing protein [uncultured Tateyamaria sp.]|uniref:VPLPA-CTERM sorting domain-containing protein n=1 Tax=uncultured Tateyamaria sp. TaxID=455651 RepID=UPI0026184BFD|nr:VPLPA-CTERM sorting domain-containing protein [uncultured Tateyamaria sp.]